MNKLLELSGHYYEKGKPVPFSLSVYAPERDSASGDYFCTVASSELFSKEMKIFGVTPKQAVRLALAGINAALGSEITSQLSDDVPKT